MTWSRTGAIACAALALGVACVRADLEGHACPCLEGYTCVEGACVKGSDPPESPCPERFSRADACDDTPPPSGTLIAVCDDGASLPLALLNEVGSGAGLCYDRPPLSARLVDSDVTGSFTFTSGDGNATLELTVDGDTSWTLDVPASCKVTGNCLPSDGSGLCGTNGEDCQCTDVEVALSIGEDLQVLGDEYSGGREFFGCAQGDTLYLREDEGLGLQGPILVFSAE